MKIINVYWFFLLLFSVNTIGAQTIYVEKEGLYGSRVNVPITIDVQSSHFNYKFYAHNKSYFPYTIHLEIKHISNLTPVNVDQRFKVNPGRNMLLELKAQDASRTTAYQYDFTYSIGVKGSKVDPEFPYLIPVKSSFGFMSGSSDNSHILRDKFMMIKGDTVYASRRGKIVATSDMFDGTDRVSQNSSFEVLHTDGTIMVYENIDPDKVFIKAGKDVYPGQPIGLVNNYAYLKLILYQSTGDGYLKELDIQYYVDEENIEPFSDKLNTHPVIHPMSIITKEFKKRELKSLKKGDLVL